VSRDIDIDPREPASVARINRAEPIEPVPAGYRQSIEFRGRTFQLRPSEHAALRHVGTFRVVNAGDLQQFLYAGNRTKANQDLRSLIAQGLLRRHTVAGQRRGPRMAVVSLTREGAALVRQAVPEGQVMYDGFVKPREVPHDAALYRMYHAASHRIEQDGGRVRRVVLDYELKRQIQQGLNASGASAAAVDAFRERVASEHGLRIVDGTIQIPDLRLEYETSSGYMARVDLELATEHYKPSQLAAKARAGFTLYAPEAQAGRITAALEERDIIVEILSL
jgi:hypothetical protein